MSNNSIAISACSTTPILGLSAKFLMYCPMGRFLTRQHAHESHAPNFGHESLVMSQTEFHSVDNQKENCHYTIIFLSICKDSPFFPSEWTQIRAWILDRDQHFWKKNRDSKHHGARLRPP